MRKVCAVIGAIFGLLYTIIGMRGGYNNPDIASPPLWRVVMEFCVLSVFTVAFCFAIGMGVGLLLEGLFKRKEKKS